MAIRNTGRTGAAAVPAPARRDLPKRPRTGAGLCCVTCEISPLPPGVALPLSVMHCACFADDPWDAAALERILALSGVFGYLAWQADAPAGFILARDLGERGRDPVVRRVAGAAPAGHRAGLARCGTQRNETPQPRLGCA